MQDVEQSIRDSDAQADCAGAGAPRVTYDDIKAAIVNEQYSVFGTLTICVLTLRNGFTVTGESACASPENFNAEYGRELARKDAVNKVWTLEAYLLRDRLHAARAHAQQNDGG